MNLKNENLLEELGNKFEIEIEKENEKNTNIEWRGGG